MTKIRVLVVDDSSFLRRTLPRLLESDPGIQVIDTAVNGVEALEKAKLLRPDVITLDVIMPVMDGLTALKLIMQQVPTPVVMLSSTTDEGARETLMALEFGAVDFITKPSGPISLNIEKTRIEIIAKIKAANSIRSRISQRPDSVQGKFRSLIDTLAKPPTVSEAPRFKPVPSDPPRVHPPLHTPPVSHGFKASAPGSKKLVALATSTGGPVALQTLLPKLPATLNAGIVIVQHIARGFSQMLAERLNELSEITVVEAKNGQLIKPGVALLSPGDMHMTVVKTIQGLAVNLSPEPASQVYRPSADVFFHSIATCCPEQTCAVIMTGMGDDGAVGIKAIRDRGGHTIAQDETSCLIYGMSRRAIEVGGASVTLPLEQIADEIIRVSQKV